MAILDRQNIFSDGQAVSGTTAVASTDVMSNGPLYNGIGGANAARDLGVGSEVYLQVNVSGVSGTSPTLTVALETDDNSSFSSASTIASYGPISLPAAGGQALTVCLPFGDYEEFMRLKYTLGGTSPAATIKAALVRDVTAQKVYSGASVIS